MADRLRLGIQIGIGTALQFRDHPADPLWMILNPCAQPTADISAARDGGEIMKFIEQAAARQPLQNSESKGCTANAATRYAKRSAFLFSRERQRKML